MGKKLSASKYFSKRGFDGKDWPFARFELEYCKYLNKKWKRGDKPSPPNYRIGVQVYVSGRVKESDICRDCSAFDALQSGIGFCGAYFGNVNHLSTCDSFEKAERERR